jgi:hypothetical protein
MSDQRWRRIEELFHRAADLAPVQRAEFLSRVCSGDIELRRQVESLLANDESKNDALEAAVAKAVDQLPTLSPGGRLGPYEILAPIGAGGMGEVYRARDTKLERDVAIKVLPAALAQDPERLARFQREAKVLASLNHPNIAQIYGIEERALVMELVPGEPLQGPLPPNRRVHRLCTFPEKTGRELADFHGGRLQSPMVAATQRNHVPFRAAPNVGRILLGACGHLRARRGEAVWRRCRLFGRRRSPYIYDLSTGKPHRRTTRCERGGRSPTPSQLHSDSQFLR